MKQTTLSALFGKTAPVLTATENSTKGIKRTLASTQSNVISPAKKQTKLATNFEQSKRMTNYTIDSLLETVQDQKWKRLLAVEMNKDYFKKLLATLNSEISKKKEIFPPFPLILHAFDKTKFDEISVVLLGQDPYHNDNQAHGLCFSVPMNINPPPSLKNIYTELKANYPDFKTPNHGFLENWANKGMFMLNASLTVEAHKANSHATFGWQIFTDNVIKMISKESKNGVVFLLWGNFAHKKEALIDAKKHRIVKSAHPSPLSVRFFKGCKCFKKVDDALVTLGKEPFHWNCLA
uniref:Uracil-DNA glycosylase n=1 Tax=Rhabditophanes sp. KR3021 TaxID=114890 RepID=A0AC35UBM4_9BILA